MHPVYLARLALLSAVAGLVLACVEEWAADGLPEATGEAEGTRETYRFRDASPVAYAATEPPYTPSPIWDPKRHRPRVR